MKENRLSIQINKPLSEVFKFTITPPNSSWWIPDVISEETSEWPIRVGTVYVLQDRRGENSEVIVADLKKDDFVEWVSKSSDYHCRYKFRSIKRNLTELEYYEWVDKGELESPFTIEILKRLKSVLE